MADLVTLVHESHHLPVILHDQPTEILHIRPKRRMLSYSEIAFVAGIEQVSYPDYELVPFNHSLFVVDLDVRYFDGIG